MRTARAKTMARKLQRDRVSPRALSTSIHTLFLTAEMVIPGLTYRLGSTLYVALTNRCNAVPLPQTRGPGFAMSSSSGFVPLPAGNEPSAADVAEAVRAAFASHDIPSEVCFAGVGEPLLRLRELEAAAALRTHCWWRYWCSRHSSQVCYCLRWHC